MQGARVGEKDEEGNTPLHLVEISFKKYDFFIVFEKAAESGNKEAARVLLHHGAR